MIQENTKKAINGFLMLGVLFIVQGLLVVIAIKALMSMAFVKFFIVLVLNLLVFINWFGFFMVQPKVGKVLQLFGNYVGTVRDAGLCWANPFYSKKRVSLRVRNFESSN